MSTDGGASAIEFALVGPLLLLVLCGLIDTGRAIWTHIGVQSAVQEASMYAAYAPDDEIGISARAVGAVDWPNLAADDISIWCPSPDGEDVAVRVHYDLALVTPVIGRWLGGTIGLEETVIARTLSTRRCEGG